MQDIANELNMKAASLYNHIASKQEILSSLLLEGAQLFIDRMEEVQRSQLSLTEKIEQLIVVHVRLSVDRTDLMALMAVEWRHLEGEALSQYKLDREQYEAAFRGLISEAIAKEELQPVDVELALFSILTTLQRLYAWYDRHSHLNPFDLEKYLIQCLLGGLRR